jgi:hypothetical protein
MSIIESHLARAYPENFTYFRQGDVGSISPQLATSIVNVVDGAIRFRSALTPSYQNETEPIGTQTGAASTGPTLFGCAAIERRYVMPTTVRN